MMIFLSGGAKNGKSTLAQELAEEIVDVYRALEEAKGGSR